LRSVAWFKGSKREDIGAMKNPHIHIEKLDAKMEPSIKVKVQLTLEFPLPGKRIEEVERAFSDVFDEAKCRCLGKYLQCRDEQIVFEEMDTKEREICKIDHERTLKAPYGDIPCPCRQIVTAGGYSIPLLRELGLEDKQRIVVSSYENSLTNAALTTFRKAQHGVKNPMSLGAFHDAFQKRFRRERKAETAGLEYAIEAGYDAPAPRSDVARVMDDGIWIRKRTLPGRGAGLRQGTGTSMEVKITRCDFGDENNPAYWSYPPAIYASIESSEDHVRHGSVFLDMTTGLSRAAHAIHLSDAKANGKRHCTEYNPNSVWQLDWYHLGRHLRVLSRIDRPWRDEVWEFLNVERPDEAMESVRSGLEKMKRFSAGIAYNEDADFAHLKRKNHKWWEDRTKEVEGLLGYLHNQREGIYGVRKLVGVIPAEYLPFGSGPMERLCAVVGAHRMKGHGKAWRTESAQNMIFALRKTFSSSRENPLLQQAINDALLWDALQKEPVIHPRGGETTAAQYSKRHPYPVKEGNFPVVLRGKCDSLYHTLKSIRHGTPCIQNI